MTRVLVEDLPDTPADPAPPSPGLDALTAQAVALEGIAAPAAPAGPPPPDTATELRAVLELVRVMLSPVMAWWPDYGTVWSDATIDGIATNAGAICDRHGWSVGDNVTRWGPYIGLAGATLPPAVATVQAIKWRQAEAARRAQQQPPESAEGVRP